MVTKEFNNHLTHPHCWVMTKILWLPKRQNKGWIFFPKMITHAPPLSVVIWRWGYVKWRLKFFSCQKGGRIIPHDCLLGNWKISIIIRWWGCVGKWLNFFSRHPTHPHYPMAIEFFQLLGKGGVSYVFGKRPPPLYGYWKVSLAICIGGLFKC